MIKIPYKYGAVILGIILWFIYRIESEFAFYNIYSIFSYSVHEIMVFVPILTIIMTIILLIVEVRNQLKNKQAKIGNMFSLLLCVLLILQFAHFYNLSLTESTFTVGKIVEIDYEKGSMIIETANLDKTHQFEVQAEGSILNIFEPGDTEYGISFESKRNKPDVRKVSSIIYRPQAKSE